MTRFWGFNCADRKLLDVATAGQESGFSFLFSPWVFRFWVPSVPLRVAVRHQMIRGRAYASAAAPRYAILPSPTPPGKQTSGLPQDFTSDHRIMAGTPSNAPMAPDRLLLSCTALASSLLYHACSRHGTVVVIIQASSWVHELQKKPSGRSAGTVVHSGRFCFTWCGAVGRWTEGRSQNEHKPILRLQVNIALLYSPWSIATACDL